ncbi:hypothetical protein H257_15871 [Aphanomyces astaci]|uniref:Cyclic nucleotide-binding domain-containing protein n=1 Tax=Aphanomyces astaci TaxID=112090 RepID=W4FKZ4_APHAT|nr:hypothetical protein H257_15871 [Aphanomyces astaci]ETV68140.1 hypothetical protein H257_15871 [Aphanomyces astaci]|eukprot:XP_009842439.1 hypothetical protein H257_15871 [Aphanomyces astaci]
MKKAKGKIKFCAQSLQAKFALRRMYMSGVDLSQQQLEFVVDFLERETIVHRMQWWQRLTHTERLALAKDIKLKYVHKGETVDIRTNELKVSYVVLRGSAEGYILDRPNQVPVHLRDGSVFGNLHFNNAVHAHTSHVGWVGDPTGTSGPKSKFQKVVLRGPVDCLVLSAENLVESATALAHVTTHNCLHLFGMSILEPYVRYRSFDAGATIVHQGDAKSNFYIIVQGTAKATFKDDSIVAADRPVVSSLQLPGASPRAPYPKELEVAILGPQSYVGDISSLFDLPEPVTVKCTTDVDAVYFMLDELYEALKPFPTVHHRMQYVAFRTLEFIVERLQLLFGMAWSSHSKTHDTLTTALADFHLPPLPPLSNDEVPVADAPASLKPGSPTTKSMSPQRQSPKKLPTATSTDPGFQHVQVDTRDMTPIEPTKDMILAMHSMHSSFRKSAASTMLVQPPLLQPTDYLQFRQQDPHSTTAPLPPCIPPPRKAKAKRTTNQLFLFPTMTKQRQYHTRSLPLLQKCSGIETPWCQPQK